jgi:hypothetical protein
MTFEVEIEERRVLKVKIEADSEEEAVDITRGEYEALVHDLNYPDFIQDVSFSCDSQ